MPKLKLAEIILLSAIVFAGAFYGFQQFVLNVRLPV